MRILVTGGNGQLATALAADPRFDLHRVGRPRFDFDRPESIDEVFAAVAPALVINAAAYTAVDQAESEPDASLRANRDGPARLASLCAASGARLIHISTDYVFDGGKGAPYVESDGVNPTGMYGRSKLEGERAVMATLPGAVILRTAWVYAATGKNFVRTMLGAAKKTSRLRVVADQVGCPTVAEDLAAAILTMVPAVMDGAPGGIYHAVGTGETSWHGLAVATFEEAVRHGLPMPDVAPITTEEWPTPAKRPADSRLDCGKLADAFGVRLPPWRPSLARTVDAILARE